MKVKLNSKLDREALRLYDYEIGKYLAPKNFGKGEAFTVEDSRFVRDKIRTGELEVVEAGAASTSKNGPDNSTGSGGNDAPTAEAINAAREAVTQAEAALGKAKDDMKNAEDATQKGLAKDAIENAGRALGEAKSELKRLEKLAK